MDFELHNRKEIVAQSGRKNTQILCKRKNDVYDDNEKRTMVIQTVRLK